MIFICPPQLARGYRRYVDKALAAGHEEMDANDVFRLVDQGKWTLWAKPGKGIVCTEFCQYPKYKSLLIRLLGSDGLPSDWLNDLQTIEEWAKANGCKSVEAFGRFGWLRRMPGYGMTHAIARKEL